ncbi:MAG: hypothetical protein V7744_20315 [Pseudomonadales bacterium]
MMKWFLTTLSLLALSCGIHAAEISATPGTYELVEGSSMQFDGKPKAGAPDIKNYQWHIFSGEGAKLLNANQAKATFVAPSIKEETRLYTLQLTLQYTSGKESSAQINIRVHRKSKTVQRRSSSPWISGAIGFGFGYLWGGWWDYPPIVVIPCPLPDIILLPEDLEPFVMPMELDPGYNDWIDDNPSWDEAYIDEEADFNDNDLIDAAPMLEENPELFDEPMIEAAPMIEPAPMMPEPMDDMMDMGGGMDDMMMDGGFDDY